jgi:hypothetical protein
MRGSGRTWRQSARRRNSDTASPSRGAQIRAAETLRGRLTCRLCQAAVELLAAVMKTVTRRAKPAGSLGASPS